MQNRICGKRQQKQDNRETNRRGWREVTLESDGKSTEGRALWRQPRGQREAAEEVERLEVLVVGFRTTGSGNTTTWTVRDRCRSLSKRNAYEEEYLAYPNSRIGHRRRGLRRRAKPARKAIPREKRLGFRRPVPAGFCLLDKDYMRARAHDAIAQQVLISCLTHLIHIFLLARTL
ncbi:hypothetical protein GW17_00049093 [Ensete ventricosum]|nr:hypothetical protein GW17_00049093 [Ensete ventricosum]